MVPCNTASIYTVPVPNPNSTGALCLISEALCSFEKPSPKTYLREKKKLQPQQGYTEKKAMSHFFFRALDRGVGGLSILKNKLKKN